MTKLIAVVMMMITLNVNAMPHWVCDPMRDVGEATIQLKLTGISYQTAIEAAKTKWRMNGTEPYIQDYISAIIEVGYDTSLDARTYGSVVYDQCRQQELNIY